MTISDYTAWDGKLIKKGTKLVKAFKHFIKNDRSLTDIQNEASRIIQEDKIEGTLCLSVHPLDFLSVSENTYNWRSCHALDGEYRAGNLSYMMDKSTVICYLKATDSAQLPSFPGDIKWNSKKWRVLLYLSNDWKMIIAGRQYPFETSVGMDIVLKDLLPASKLLRDDKNRYWTDWNNLLYSEVELTNRIKIEFDSSYVPIGNELISLDELVTNGEGSKQFNDVLLSSCYKPIYSMQYITHFWDCNGGYLTTNRKDTKFVIGGYTYCLWCGEKETLLGADTMMCDTCELEHGTSENDMFTTCDCCGRRMYFDDGYGVGDEEVCEECYRKYCRRCENCGETIFTEDAHYHEKTEQYLCSECYYELEE